MRRTPQLDGIRGIAILLVLIWHYIWGQIVVVAEPTSVLAYSIRIFRLTWSGVDLFFVLSGFLIVGLLLDHRNSTNYFRVFYLRRICRIFPLYFLVLALFILFASTGPFSSSPLQGLFGDPLPLWSYATFTQNILMGDRGDFGPLWLGITWSLAVEEQFYLLVPLLIYFLPRRTLLWVLMVGLLAAPALRYAYPGFHAFVGTPWRADSLLSGAVLAILVRDPSFVSAVRSRRSLLFVCFIALLVGAAMLTPKLGGVIDHLLLAGLYVNFILIGYLEGESIVGRLLQTRFLVWFGQLSYGIYMLHEAVSGLLHAYLRGASPQIRSLSDAAVTALALCVTLFLAMLSYRFIEGPIIRFGHRFQYLPKSLGSGSLQALSKESIS